MLLTLSLRNPHAATSDLDTLKKISDCTHGQLFHEGACMLSTTALLESDQGGIYCRVGYQLDTTCKAMSEIR
jgi:hypothetical protein